MEPPVVPFASRSRFTRDYTNDEEEEYGVAYSPPIAREVNGSGSLGRHNSLRVRSYNERTTSARTETASPILGEQRNGTLDQKRHLSPLRHQPQDEYQDDSKPLDFGLDNADEQDLYGLLVESRSRTSRTTSVSDSSSSKMPSFFGSEVFQTVLHNPTTAHQLLKFSQSRLCGENMEFLDKVNRYHALLNDVNKTIYEIHREFISVNAANQINIDQSVLTKTNKDLKNCLAQTLPKLESVFVDSQSSIERLMLTDIYPRFVRHQLTMSASKALGNDRGKYAGLGDCFVLTDPAKADNPITYASDGFVKVTGYTRKEIIPRNCRFLQCSHTDRSSVKRVRQAIDRREESVELLLNQKKNGEPFWNLLYTAPLFDNRGNVAFFIGGQINCSTTIHSASDILRILAQTSDVEDTHDASGSKSPEPVVKQPQPSRANRILSAFRSNSATKAAQLIPTHTPGMENNLLVKIERMNLQKQMDTFYTAYSKYLVVNASSFVVHFHSAGILDFLYPSTPFPPLSRPSTHDQHTTTPTSPNTLRSRVPSPCGHDVFKFLASHSPEARLPKGFKEKVKGAVKLGQPLSVSLSLCTRRHMGYETFVIHWTTLKDEEGQVGWLIVTMSSVAG